MNLHEKYKNLKNIIKDYGNLAVAFSGGVDSAFLLKTAFDVLGDRVMAVTARLCFCPDRELKEAIEFCEKEKIRHIFCDVEILESEAIAQNPTNRCYLCKNEILNKIKQAVEPFDIKYIAEGSNADDSKYYRPGFQAVTEHKIKSPLKEAGLSKSEIRELSKELGLPTWNKQSYACLASRFVYGDKIIAEKLVIIDKAEQFLIDLGFSQIRVRIHGSIARIEINPDEFAKIIKPEISRKIYAELKLLGFSYVTLDLLGYRFGSMDEEILKK